MLGACREPGLNQRPPDLQSGALPTELSRRKLGIVLPYLIIGLYENLEMSVKCKTTKGNYLYCFVESHQEISDGVPEY